MSGTSKKVEQSPDPFEGYVGQESLVASIRRYLYLPTIPNLFFVAMKGSGKSDLTRRISTASGKAFYEIGCRQGMKLDSILYRHAMLWNGGVLFFDELPLMSRTMQGSLRTLAEDGVFYDKDGYQFDFPDLTILAAGTDITKIDDDLIDRFNVMEFDTYSIDDLTLIGQGFDLRFGTALELSTIQSLACACNGSPRKLRQLIQHSAGAILASGGKATTDEILEVARICPDGMSPLERTVLRRMALFIQDGANPTLSRLATVLRMRERALIPSIERLQGLGFVTVSMGPGGTRLTPDGITKIREIGLI